MLPHKGVGSLGWSNNTDESSRAIKKDSKKLRRRTREWGFVFFRGMAATDLGRQRFFFNSKNQKEEHEKRWRKTRWIFGLAYFDTKIDGERKQSMVFVVRFENLK